MAGLPQKKSLTYLKAGHGALRQFIKKDLSTREIGL
jgi:hypothetical protein